MWNDGDTEGAAVVASDDADDRFSKIPDNLRTFIEDVGIFIPPDMSDAELMVMRRGQRGLCMTCTAPLAENTIAMVSGLGIMMVFCQPACMQDHEVMAWLSSTYEEMVSTVKMRSLGEGADRAE